MNQNDMPVFCDVSAEEQVKYEKNYIFFQVLLISSPNENFKID